MGVLTRSPRVDYQEEVGTGMDWVVVGVEKSAGTHNDEGDGWKDGVKFMVPSAVEGRE